jgi:hypothetical protein
MSFSKFDEISGVLKSLGDLVPKSSTYAPLLTRSKVTCLVDDRFQVHALRTADSAAGQPDWHKLEYAVLAPGGPPAVKWHAVSAPIFNPACPWLSVSGDDITAGVLGVLEQPDAALQTQAYQALIVRSSADKAAKPVPAMKRVRAGLRVAAGPGGALVLLAPSWFPPTDVPSVVSLRLGLLKADAPSDLAEPVPGSDYQKSFPSDAALHVTGDAKIHVVYDGLREAAKERAQWWHLTLDGAGRLVAERALGVAPRRPILTRIVVGPDRHLRLLTVFADDQHPTRFMYQLYALDGTDTAPGGKEQYFTDHWLQLHAIGFDGQKVEYRGPAGVPGG